MAGIATYTELVDAISNWLNHGDPSTLDRVPTFIRLAELRTGRDLRTLRLQKQLTYTVTSEDATEGSIPLPDDYNGMVAAYLGYGKLEQISTDQWLRSNLRNTGGSSAQVGYTLIGDRLVVASPVGEGTTVNMVYYGLPEPLGASNQGSLLLKYYSDMLLYGALAEAMPFLKDEKRLPNFANLYQSALQTVELSDARMRSEDSPQLVTNHFQADSNNYRSTY